MWVRGLKLTVFELLVKVLLVAPHVGAWIETYLSGYLNQSSSVAPHVGAWIETYPARKKGFRQIVAPHVGAWIETEDECKFKK